MLPELIIGVHLFSVHVPQGDQNNANVGAYVQTAEDGWIAGVYRNSQRKTSVYAGRSWEHESLGVTAGLISGFGPVTPFAVPYVRLWDTVRVSYVPKFAKHPHVVHVAVEKKF